MRILFIIGLFLIQTKGALPDNQDEETREICFNMNDESNWNIKN